MLSHDTATETKSTKVVSAPKLLEDEIAELCELLARMDGHLTEELMENLC